MNLGQQVTYVMTLMTERGGRREGGRGREGEREREGGREGGYIGRVFAERSPAQYNAMTCHLMYTFQGCLLCECLLQGASLG